jgi:phosphatidylserine decarboxylase
MNIKILRQYLAPQHALSRLGGKIAECQWKWWRNWVIRKFIKCYGVDMSIAQKEHIEDYPNFNSFFTRLLKPEARPIVQESHAIACPVDGSISQIGRIQQDTLLQAKGFHFQLHNLLGGASHLAHAFEDGYFATLYLSPKDYHRVHMPLSGHLTETVYIPGKLFSVNPLTTHTVPALFARNERLVCFFETAAGPMAVILVGAMLVASINTVWSSTFNSRTVTNFRPKQPILLERGAELGHFKLGSTVIVLFAKEAIEWNQSLQENSTVQMGQWFGSIQKFTAGAEPA